MYIKERPLLSNHLIKEITFLKVNKTFLRFSSSSLDFKVYFASFCKKNIKSKEEIKLKNGENKG